MPVFTTIGLALGATVAASAAGIGAFGVGVAASALAAGAYGMSRSNESKANKSYKAATHEADVRNQAAIAEVSQSQSAASSQAQASIRAKKSAMARSQTVFTNPLGIADQATTAKKSLLGE